MNNQDLYDETRVVLNQAPNKTIWFITALILYPVVWYFDLTMRFDDWCFRRKIRKIFKKSAREMQRARNRGLIP